MYHKRSTCNHNLTARINRRQNYRDWIVCVCPQLWSTPLPCVSRNAKDEEHLRVITAPAILVRASVFIETYIKVTNCGQWQIPAFVVLRNRSSHVDPEKKNCCKVADKQTLWQTNLFKLAVYSPNRVATFALLNSFFTCVWKICLMAGQELRGCIQKGPVASSANTLTLTQYWPWVNWQ